MRFLAACLLAFAACGPSHREVEAAAIHYELGVDANGRGDIRTALQEFMTSVEKNPDMPESHNALGSLYMLGFRRPAEAEKHFRKAIELKPDFSDAYNNLGTLLLAQDKYDEAIATFKKALENPLYRTPYAAETNLAWALFKSGKREQGVHQMKSTLVAQPKFCHAHRTLGQMQTELGHNREAADAFEKYAKHCPESQDAHRLHADALAATGETEAARQAYERCRALGAENELGELCASAEKKLASGP